MIELTPEHEEMLRRIRPALPPVWQYNTHPEFMDGTRTLFAAFAGDEPIALDCEWDRTSGALTTIGLGNEHLIVQIDWPSLDDFRRVEVRHDVEALTRTVTIIYQNAMADIKKLRQHDFLVHPANHRRLEDTMLADAVLDSEEDHDLGAINDRAGVLPPWKPLQHVAPLEYNAADVLAPVLLWKHHFAPAFAKDPAAEDIYREQSLAFLAEIQVETEEAGIRVDRTRPHPLWAKYSRKREEAIRLAAAYCGTDLISLSSPADMKHALYVLEGLPTQFEKGPPQAEKKVTTDKDAIAALRRLQGTEWDPEEEPTLEQAWANIEAGGHPILEARYLFMGAQQARSHYIAPFLILEKGEPVGVQDRIYPEIRQHVQASGRHSFVGVPLQQLKGQSVVIVHPNGIEEHIPELQTQMTPDVGHVWIGHDWSNIETWLLGYLANDAVILEAKRGGWDTHTVNFCDITGTPYPPLLTKKLHTAAECEEWRARLKWLGEDDQRRVFSKRFVYRLHYRGDAANAGDIPGAKSLGFNAERLVDASNKYLSRHPAIVEFWRRIEAQADRHRVVYTFMGRPRRLTSQFRSARNREASNHPMQAGVADIYVTTALAVKRAAPWARFVWGAHDSQWWQVPVARKEEFQAIYKPIVTRTFEINGQEADFPASFKERIAA